MRFRTYGHIDFKFYDEAAHLFYNVDENKRRKKRVPENIHELLTARADAYWFMDDGTCKSYKSKNRTYVFNTQSFPKEDQAPKPTRSPIKKLIKALSNNFRIHATIQKQRSYYILYIRSKSTNRFVDLISPYIPPCFDYKIQRSLRFASGPLVELLG